MNISTSLYHRLLTTILTCILAGTPFLPCSYARSIDSEKIDLTELSLEQLMEIKVAKVVSASRFEQRVTEAPASVTIITADEIRKFGYRTLADIIRSIPGLYVTYDRDYSYIGVRGFGRHGDFNSRILLMIDGHRLNDNIFDSAHLGTEFPLDIDMIDNVEFVRGPGSSLYGTNAFFGVINIITRQAGDMGKEAAFAAGDNETWKGRLSYGGSYDSGLDVLMSGSILSSAGNRNLFYPEYSSDPNGPVFRNNDYDSSKSIYSRFSYGDFTLSGLYSTREKGIPTGSYNSVFNTKPNFTFDDRGYAELSYRHSFGEALNISARLFYDAYVYEQKNTYERVVGLPYVVNRDMANSRSLGGEAIANFTPSSKHRISIGTEFRNNLSTSQTNLDVTPYQINLDYNNRSTNWSVFTHIEHSIFSTLILNTGVRYDNYRRFDSINPRISMIWTPIPKSAFKLMYGEAFRAPNAYESYYNDNGITQKSDPALKPEKIRTYEAAWEQYFNAHCNTSVSAFYYRINNLISLITDPADSKLVYRNVDRVEAKGVDLALQLKSENGLIGRFSYTWQDATDADSGAWLVNSPRHLAKANVSIPVYRSNIFISPEIQYIGRRLTLAGNKTKDAATANLTILGRDLIKGLEASASIYNLFDTSYSDPGSGEHRQDSIKQDGINFRFKLSYRF
jgi:iron complex outermembrane receptor protein